jgi:hypothetical protein
MTLRFVENPLAPVRRRTREVRVGEVGIGGANPIRIQSMTNTDPCDAKATAAQVEALARAGCEIVRVATPSVRDAEKLGAIRSELDKRGRCHGSTGSRHPLHGERCDDRGRVRREGSHQPGELRGQEALRNP